MMSSEEISFDFQFDLEPSMVLFRKIHDDLNKFPPFSRSLFLSKELKEFRKSEVMNVLVEILMEEASKPSNQETSIWKSMSLTIVHLFRPILGLILSHLMESVSNSLSQPTNNNSNNNNNNNSFERSFIVLGRLLPFSTSSVSFTLNWLSQMRDMCERMMMRVSSRNNNNNNVVLNDEMLTELLRSCVRLFRLSSEFGSLFDWTPFFSFHSSNSTTPSRLAYFSRLAMSLKLGINLDSTTNDEMEIETTFNDVEESTLSSLESLLFSEARSILAKNISSSLSPLTLISTDLPSQFVDVCGVILTRHFGFNNPSTTTSTSQQPQQQLSSFVYTKTSKKNLREVALALSEDKPILLSGESGSGKSSVVEELARKTGNLNHVLTLHLGEETDSKSLIGTYVSTEVPGEFRWQEGALTWAIRNGSWLLIEDIDLSPPEILSALIPVLENRTLFIPSKAHTIPAKPGFQLFATLSHSSTSRTQPLSITSNLWNLIKMEKLSEEEIRTVISTRFHSLSLILPFFTRLLTTVSPFKQIGLRELIKYCERIKSFSLDWRDSNHLSLGVREKLYRQAMECFALSIHNQQKRIQLFNSLASLLEIPTDRIHYWVNVYQPTFELSQSSFSIGSANLLRQSKEVSPHQHFAYTKSSLRLVEQVANSVSHNEPVLLVGDTGVGKTYLVQFLSNQLNQKLVVLNLSQQSESIELVGGFKPIEMDTLCAPLFHKFQYLFPKTFSKSKNQAFWDKVVHSFEKRQWNLFFKGIIKATELIHQRFLAFHNQQSTEKLPSQLSPEIRSEWKKLEEAVFKLQAQKEEVANNFAFSFVEGPLPRALREGHWILLDEINLAPSELLESLSSLVGGGSITLTEKGETKPIPRHPNFRLFACMNPPDVGKKELSVGLRKRFSEIFVDEMTDKQELTELVKSYLPSFPVDLIPDVVNFYLQVRIASNSILSDGANMKPHYSLRTLCRALKYAQIVSDQYTPRRAVYEGICASFLTQLNDESSTLMESLISKFIVKGGNENAMMQPGKKPLKVESEFLESFWVPIGPLEREQPKNYIRTKSIGRHIKNLSRIIVSQRFPILLQGPTSAGKTSMVEYLAKRTGHRFVRINNHEHTDLQEYLGTYIPDSDGKLVFQEGILVEAVRKGYWVVLDELNLAPSEVLEALNRLLDDNRQLYLPETQTTINAHPHFMLFATQNPAGLYGGRKALSRAFRNRFFEIHVQEIPSLELSEILEKRCLLPTTWAKALIEIMKELQRVRAGSQVFAGREGYITLRDLFRWADRKPTTKEEVAEIGYMLLAERVRKPNEKQVIQEVIEKNLKVEINLENLYNRHDWNDLSKQLELLGVPTIVWTYSMRRLFTLVLSSIRSSEPFLLVGETGTGKTTICEVISKLRKQEMMVINCHEHTETADFVGGLRPTRDRQLVVSKIKHILQQSQSIQTIIQQQQQHQKELFSLDSQAFLSAVRSLSNELKKENEWKQLEELLGESESLFRWYDGPLVRTMKHGQFLLIDEISLADDAVLERLNSVLEPQRLLVLPEKGSKEIEEFRANEDFRIMATMNPGGDFGKRELSPALRNRFTEIWVPAIERDSELEQIVSLKLTLPDPMPKNISSLVVAFSKWFQANNEKSAVVSVRDLSGWVEFINRVSSNLDPFKAFLHGALMLFVDSLNDHQSRQQSINKLKHLLSSHIPLITAESSLSTFQSSVSIVNTPDQFGVSPFLVKKFTVTNSTTTSIGGTHYALDAPTTSMNVMRIMRGMQLSKAILLEGEPGVGKSSLIAALAEACGQTLVRINLSEQTELMDLLGTNLPVEGEGSFEWCDGVFLQALKNGHWVLLDELNLASQSVLEGLNSCLDHRATIYLPDLDRSFNCPPSFRIFGAQNPVQGGGGRKGLPKSFLNRFTKVYLDKFTSNDLNFIARSSFPLVEPDLLSRMISFNSALQQEIESNTRFATEGRPWELNLRDVFRWCQLLDKHPTVPPSYWVDLLYLQRFRTNSDRIHLNTIYSRFFPSPQFPPLAEFANPSFSFNIDSFQAGLSSISRKKIRNHSLELNSELVLLPGRTKSMESVMKSMEMGWMVILIGPESSGKTSLVRSLATLTGNKLNEFCMNTAVDTSDILGGFEQLDLSKKKRDLLSQLDQMVRVVSQLLIEQQQHQQNQQQDSTNTFKSFTKIQTTWSLLQSLSAQQESISTRTASSTSSTSSSTIMDEEQQKQQELIQPSPSPLVFQVEELELAKRLLESLEKEWNSLSSQSQQINSILSEFQNTPSELSVEMEKMRGVSVHSSSGRFEWIDGMLVECMQRGEWLLIDHVNFCNPTVLDRLNPLFENNGSLLLNERGLIDGKSKHIKPHPNFRVFFCMDPKNGEISRAMRNRGVEIVLLPPDHQDPQVLFSSFGIPKPITTLMIETHLSIKERVGWRELLKWAKHLTQELSRGTILSVALSDSMHRSYAHLFQFDQTSLQNAINSFPTICNSLFSKHSDWMDGSSWPQSIPVSGSFSVGLRRPIISDSLLRISSINKFYSIHHSSIELSLDSIQNSRWLSRQIWSSSNLLGSLLEWLVQFPSDQSSTSFQFSQPSTTTISDDFKSLSLLSIYLDTIPFNTWKFEANLFSRVCLSEKAFSTISSALLNLDSQNIWKSISNTLSQLWNSNEKQLSRVPKPNSIESGWETEWLLGSEEGELFRKSSIQSERLISQFNEHNFLQSSSTRINLSALERSYLLFSSKRVVASQNKHDQWLMPLLYPLLHTIDQLLDSFPLQPKSNSRKFDSLFSLRRFIVHSLSQTSMNTANSMMNEKEINKNSDSAALMSQISIQWRWLRKKLVSVWSLVPDWMSERLTALADKLDSNLRQIGFIQSENPLHSYGRFFTPFFRDNLDLFLLHSRFNFLCDHSSQKLSKEEKRLILEAVSTIVWLNLQADRSSHSNALSHFTHLIQSLETKYPIEVKAKPTNETNESSSNEKEVDPKPSAPKKQTDIESSVFESHLLFDPKIIHNFKSMRAELFLLNKLSRQILSPHFNIKTGSLDDEGWKELGLMSEEIEKFIEECLSYTSRSPIDLQPFQWLVWSLNSKEKANGVLIQSIFNQLHHRFNRILWNWKQLNTTIQNSIIPIEGSVSYGIETALITTFVNDWDKMPISIRPALSSQVKKLIDAHSTPTFKINSSLSSTMKTTQQREASDLEWILLFRQLAECLLCFWKSINEFELMRELLNKIDSLLQNTTTPSSDTEIGIAVSKIKDILTTSTDFEQLQLKEFVFPLLHLIHQHQHNFLKSHKKTTSVTQQEEEQLNVEEKYKEETNELKRLSKGWMLMGLIRLRGMMPNSIDPALSQYLRLEFFEWKIKRHSSLIDALSQSILLRRGQSKLDSRRFSTLEFALENSRKKANSLRWNVPIRQTTITTTDQSDSHQQSDSHSTELIASQFATLFQTIQSSLSFISPSILLSIVEENEQQQHGNEMQQVKLIDEKLSLVIQELDKWNFHQDLLQPISTALFELKHSLKLASISFSISPYALSLIPIASNLSSMPLVDRVELAKTLVSESVVESFTKLSKSEKEKEEMLGLLTKQSLFLSYLAASNDLYSSETLPSINELFGLYVDAVTRLRREEEERIAAAQATFKYRTKQNDIPDQKQKNDEEFKQLFPDYSQFFFYEHPQTDENGNQIPVSTTHYTTEDDATKKEGENKVEGREELISALTTKVTDKDVIQLFSVHQHLFRSELGRIVLSKKKSNSSKSTFKSKNNKNIILPPVNVSNSTTIDANSETYYRDRVHTLSISNKLIETVLRNSNWQGTVEFKAGLVLMWEASQYLEKGIGKSVSSFDPEILRKSPLVEQSLNIYVEPMADEAHLLFEPLASLKSRLSELLIQWPEHPILNYLSYISNRLLMMPVTNPFMKFITGLDMLVKKSEEWEEVASTAVSLRAVLTPLNALLSRWRKIEIQCWPAVLKLQEQTFITNSAQFWLRLYPIVHNSTQSELFETLENFIQTSSVGDILQRIETIESFSNQFQKSSALEVFGVDQISRERGNILWTVRAIYGLYVEEFKEYLSEQLKPIISKTSELSTLTNWDLRSYARMKDASEKAQRHLHKIAIEYKELLGTPFHKFLLNVQTKHSKQINSIDSTSSSTSGAPTATNNNSSIQRFSSQIFISTLQIPKEDENESRMEDSVKHSRKQMDQILSVMKKLSTTHLLEPSKSTITTTTTTSTTATTTNERNLMEVVWEGSEELEEMCGAVIERSSTLRNSEAKVNEKRLAFNQVLKQLHAMGFSHLMKTANSQSTLSIFSQDSLLPLKSNNLFVSEDLIEKLNQYYAKCVAKLLRMRASRSNPSKDLNVSDISKGSGFSENLFSTISIQRATIFSFISKLSKFDSMVSLIASLDPSNRSFFPPNLLSEIHQSQTKLRNGLWSIVCDLEVLISPIQGKASSVISLISQSKSQLNTISTKLSSRGNVWDRKTYLEMKSTQQDFKNVWNLIESKILNSPSLENLVGSPSSKINPLFNSISILFHNVENKSSNNSTAKLTEKELEEKVSTMAEKIVSNLQIGFQSIIKQIQSFSVTSTKQSIPKPEKKVEESNQNEEEIAQEEQEEEEEQVNMMDIFKMIESSISNSKVESLSSSISELVEFVLNQDVGGGDHSKLDSYASSIGKRILPSIHQFILICDLLLKSALAYHKSMCKVSYVLTSIFNNLLQDGFCKPQKSEEQQEEGVDLDVDGTGVGEGQGKKDVSDQIENEDQVNGLKNEQQEEQNQQQEPELDKGIEMEEDFQGTMHSMPKPSEDEEKGEEEEKEGEKKEIEKEMGEVQSDEEEVVDERMWNEEDDEQEDQQTQQKQSKREQSKAPLPETSDDLAAKMGDDENKNKKDKNDKQQEGQDKDSNEKNDEEGDKPSEGEEEENGEGIENIQDKMEESHGFQLEKEQDFELGDQQDEKDKEEGDEGEGSGSDDDSSKEGENDSEKKGKEEDIQMDETNGQQKEDEKLGEEEKGNEPELIQPEAEIEKEKNEDQQNKEEEGEEKKEGEGDEPNEGPQTVDTDMNDANQQQQEEGEEEDETKEEEDKSKQPLTQQNQQNAPQLQVDGDGGVSGATEQEKSGEEKNSKKEKNGEKPESENRMADFDGLDTTNPQSNDQSQRQDQQSRSKPKPNPFRDFGDAMKQWKKRLHMIDKQINNQSNQQEQEEDDEEKEEEGDAYEFLPENSKEKENAQTLAPLHQDQKLPQDQKAIPDQQQEEELKEDKQNAKQDDEEKEKEMEEVEDFMDQDEPPKPEKPIQPQSNKQKHQKQKQSGLAAHLSESTDADQNESLEEKLARMNAENAENANKNSNNGESINPNSTSLDKPQIKQEDSTSNQMIKKIDEEELLEIRKEMQELMVKETKTEGGSFGKEMWKQLEQLTGSLSQQLCEQLRIILEPTLASRLQGDYKTGKRINMKKVIPYIASDFKKDRIWLRRTKMAKRNYQILIAIDDSESMIGNGSGQLALESMTLIARALSRLEVGQLGIASFGANFRLLHQFSQPFSDEAGPQILQKFTFAQKTTNMEHLLSNLIKSLSASKLDSRSETWQLVFIISDGRFGGADVKHLTREAESRNILIVFLIIDSPDEKKTILSLQNIAYPNGKLLITSYIDTFPFPYYILLRDLQTLPEVLCDALRQWFERVVRSSKST